MKYPTEYNTQNETDNQKLLLQRFTTAECIAKEWEQADCEESTGVHIW